MNDEKDPMYIINIKTLDRIVREIFKSEIKILVEQLKKEPKVLSREDAAKMIGVTPNTISDYVKKGFIPNRGKGRRVLILESDLVKIPRKRGFKYQNID